MAEFNGISAERADEILGMSVVSGEINESGHLILARVNGETIDAGDFSGIVTDIMDTAVTEQIAESLPDAVAGTTVEKGDVTGALFLPTLNSSNLPNAMVKVRMIDNVTFSTGALPAAPKKNTQFIIRLQQDAVGGRSFTLTGFKRSMGTLPITTLPNAIDMIAFVFDGTNWYAGLMGVDFK